MCPQTYTRSQELATANTRCGSKVALTSLPFTQHSRSCPSSCPILKTTPMKCVLLLPLTNQSCGPRPQGWSVAVLRFENTTNPAPKMHIGRKRHLRVGRLRGCPQRRRGKDTASPRRCPIETRPKAAAARRNRRHASAARRPGSAAHLGVPGGPQSSGCSPRRQEAPSKSRSCRRRRLWRARAHRRPARGNLSGPQPPRRPSAAPHPGPAPPHSPAQDSAAATSRLRVCGQQPRAPRPSSGAPIPASLNHLPPALHGATPARRPLPWPAPPPPHPPTEHARAPPPPCPRARAAALPHSPGQPPGSPRPAPAPFGPIPVPAAVAAGPPKRAGRGERLHRRPVLSGCLRDSDATERVVSFLRLPEDCGI